MKCYPISQWEIGVNWGKLSKEYVVLHQRDGDYILLSVTSWGNPDAPPVLLVHGRQDCAATFEPVLELMPRREFYYVAIDMPGSGKSNPFPRGNRRRKNSRNIIIRRYVISSDDYEEIAAMAKTAQPNSIDENITDKTKTDQNSDTIKIQHLTKPEVENIDDEAANVMFDATKRTKKSPEGSNVDDAEPPKELDFIIIQIDDDNSTAPVCDDVSDTVKIQHLTKPEVENMDEEAANVMFDATKQAKESPEHSNVDVAELPKELDFIIIQIDDDNSTAPVCNDEKVIVDRSTFNENLSVEVDSNANLPPQIKPNANYPLNEAPPNFAPEFKQYNNEDNCTDIDEYEIAGGTDRPLKPGDEIFDTRTGMLCKVGWYDKNMKLALFPVLQAEACIKGDKTYKIALRNPQNDAGELVKIWQNAQIPPFNNESDVQNRAQEVNRAFKKLKINAATDVTKEITIDVKEEPIICNEHGDRQCPFATQYFVPTQRTLQEAVTQLPEILPTIVKEDHSTFEAGILSQRQFQDASTQFPENLPDDPIFSEVDSPTSEEHETANNTLLFFFKKNRNSLAEDEQTRSNMISRERLRKLARQDINKLVLLEIIKAELSATKAKGPCHPRDQKDDECFFKTSGAVQWKHVPQGLFECIHDFFLDHCSIERNQCPTSLTGSSPVTAVCSTRFPSPVATRPLAITDSYLYRQEVPIYNVENPSFLSGFLFPISIPFISYLTFPANDSVDYNRQEASSINSPLSKTESRKSTPVNNDLQSPRTLPAWDSDTYDRQDEFTINSPLTTTEPSNRQKFLSTNDENPTLQSDFPLSRKSTPVNNDLQSPRTLPAWDSDTYDPQVEFSINSPLTTTEPSNRQKFLSTNDENPTLQSDFRLSRKSTPVNNDLQSPRTLPVWDSDTYDRQDDCSINSPLTTTEPSNRQEFLSTNDENPMFKSDFPLSRKSTPVNNDLQSPRTLPAWDSDTYDPQVEFSINSPLSTTEPLNRQEFLSTNYENPILQSDFPLSRKSTPSNDLESPRTLPARDFDTNDRQDEFSIKSPLSTTETSNGQKFLSAIGVNNDENRQSDLSVSRKSTPVNNDIQSPRTLPAWDSDNYDRQNEFPIKSPLSTPETSNKEKCLTAMGLNNNKKRTFQSDFHLFPKSTPFNKDLQTPRAISARDSVPCNRPFLYSSGRPLIRTEPSHRQKLSSAFGTNNDKNPALVPHWPSYPYRSSPCNNDSQSARVVSARYSVPNNLEVQSPRGFSRLVQRPTSVMSEKAVSRPTPSSYHGFVGQNSRVNLQHSDDLSIGEECNTYRPTPIGTRVPPASSQSTPGVKLSRFHFISALEAAVEHLRWDKFIYVAHSMGCEIGLFYNAIYPGRMIKMILFDAEPTLRRLQYNDLAEYQSVFYDDYYNNYQKQNYHYKTYTIDQAKKALMKARNLTEDKASVIVNKSLIHVADDKYRFTWDYRLKLPAPQNYTNPYYFALFNNIPPTLLISASQSLSPDESTTYYVKGHQGALELLSMMAGVKNFNHVTVEGDHDVHLSHPERVAPYVNEFLNRNHVLQSKL